jgi:pimeloyl-ACP methyl ester carboxylesterase
MISSVPFARSDLPPLNVVTLGSRGPTVVLLHGWKRSLEALRPLGELLASCCRVVLIDLPGFGASPLPFEASNDGGGWGTEEYMERVKQYLDQAGISRCVLLGHSFGGRISVRMAAKFPSLVQGVILIGSHGLRRERSFRDEVRVRAIRFLTSLAKKFDGVFGTRTFAHYLAPRFGSRDYKQAGDLRKTLVKTVNEDLSLQAQSIDVPTLLLWGEDDRETPVDLARSFNRLIKDSELHIFPGKGHEPFADVGSHLMARYIDRFLSERRLCGE